ARERSRTRRTVMRVGAAKGAPRRVPRAGVERPRVWRLTFPLYLHAQDEDRGGAAGVRLAGRPLQVWRRARRAARAAPPGPPAPGGEDPVPCVPPGACAPASANGGGAG